MITRLLFARVVYVSLLMMGAAFWVYHWELARGSGLDVARTAVVNMLVFGELVYLFNARYFVASALSRDTLTGNPMALWASVILIVLQLLITYAPPMQALFGTAALDGPSWLLITALAAAVFLAVEVEKWALRRKGVQRM
mgnify:FL=1